ncbi:bifunctional 23S rRNA (guanine(2069)-N(7))-methyltransferase RlmK/23S rRNA (guanine(2445)-N(2))-methyltransferase RlmL [Chromohalobacter sarecensis]|uniref:Ribosomal RNA large subunit methyltransferase K/L n=1 Tax=Chromohalobacter sarecensis TaxID=245294 RepID=A0ABV9D4W7_9GAMM|nr:bifunctional 23S rRNA (guanine(2069)-N(7))-methyltransferase RlmK/23S rRNA (guanine(2445)-N(2))-methyltransferase RlmL [Chromohalobacter sarecensis]MCK0714171.1 bifunctional 23S rRNA (guanine(2069)-N(7))-methyltransferase RlmK/23S rRNA (guanine(2445)-N(2))-methyltransferase RlmL [Chromohalobacter sarecensis]
MTDVQSPSLTLYVTCPRGLEGLLADELAGFGAEVTGTTVAGVHVQADVAMAYRICLWSRLANRVVLCLLREQDIERPEALVEAARRVDWRAHLRTGNSLAVDFHGQSEHIRHTRFGAQSVKDGIVDSLQAAGHERPTIELKNPDMRIYAHLHRGRLLLGLDLVGGSLHQRGYRLDAGHAPLKENLAAALLIRADWPARARRGEPLLDPMCGAGTLLIEAALMAADIAPQLARPHFAFEAWAGHDPGAWQELKREADARASVGRRRVKSTLFGRDQSPPAIAAAKANAMRAGIPALIELQGAEVAQLTRPEGIDGPGLVITNPPYGERLGELPGVVPIYTALGERLRAEFEGWQLALFTGNPDLGHRTGLRATKQYAFKNGPLDCKLLLIPVVAESASRGASAKGSTKSDSAGEQGAQEVPGRAPRNEGAQMFANRLEKNRKRLKKWLKQSGESCYRLYDADMPEYALAVDVYGDHVHVQEYAPPRSVDPRQAQRRLFDALEVIPQVLGVRPEDVHYKQRTRQSGKAQYTKQGASGERFEVSEGVARLWVNLRDYLDTGLFLDHRPVRRMLRDMADGKRFLNLFCYTGTATVQAALGGASDSVSVDLSNTYLTWARDNFALNRLDPSRHRVIRDDCLRWLETAGSEFDLIFMDPPTFSNSKKMDDVLDVQRDHARLIELAMARLSADGTLVFSNNQRRFTLDTAIGERFAVEDISARTFDPDFARRPDLHHCFLIRHR